MPLRFIAQALGASVDWNNSNDTVTITGSGNQNGSGYNNSDRNRYRQNQQSAPFSLSNETPTNAVNTQSPSIRATYSEPVSRGSMRVAIDGRDVTRDIYSNASGFNVTPSFALGAGRHHQVTVTGTTQNGQAFSGPDGASGSSIERNPDWTTGKVADAAQRICAACSVLAWAWTLRPTSALTKARELRHDEEQNVQDEETVEAQASTPAARNAVSKRLQA